MKQVLSLSIFCLFISAQGFGQVNPSYRFSSSTSNVIAYKQGTSCTAAPYAFYMIDDAGNQASTPFYTVSSTTKEINGIGINPVDRYLYGIQYDRDAACAFSNFHLMRYDAAGNSEDLGTLPPSITGGTVTAALGCITNNGNFVYSTRDAAGNSYVTLIANLSALLPNLEGILSINVSRQIINTASNYSYADWAVHPTNSKLYTYGIANIGGVSTGRVLELDPLTGILQAVGSADNTDFLDVMRDNFGGVYFGSDAMLYGVNINTRKLYRINSTTGDVTYKNTMSGSGQIRADMGSYVTGWIILPINFEKIAIIKKEGADILTWRVITNHSVKEFVIEQSTNGKEYTAIQQILLTTADKSKTDFSTKIPTSISAMYRVKAIGTSDEVGYSMVVKYTPAVSEIPVVLGNPIQNKQLRFAASISGKQKFQITSAAGSLVQAGEVVCSSDAPAAISVPQLSSGVYILQLTGVKNSVRFMIP